MNTIFYLFLIVITGVGLSLMTMYYPQVRRVLKRYMMFKRKVKPTTSDEQLTQTAILALQVARLQETIKEQNQQIDNIAQNLVMTKHNLSYKINRQIDKKLKQIITEDK